MGERRQIGQRAAMALIGLVVLCIVGAGALVALRPRRFETHTELIGYVLEQHGIAHEQVAITHDWPDPPNFYGYSTYISYGASIKVTLPDAREARGRLECGVRRRNCAMYFPALGLSKVELPDLIQPGRRSWLARWWQRVADTIGAGASAGLPWP